MLRVARKPKHAMVRPIANGDWVEHSDQGGFTYLAALFLIAVLGALLASTGMLWSTAQQREKERDLLFVGHQFRKAIGQYYEKSPGTVKNYPKTLDSLLKDDRQLATQRYLRKVFIDPMTKTNQWGLIQAPDGGIKGVYSLSNVRPLKTDNFIESDQSLVGKSKYSDWQFVYVPVK